MLWYLFIYKGKMGIVSAVSVDKIAIPFDDLLYYWRGDIREQLEIDCMFSV